MTREQLLNGKCSMPTIKGLQSKDKKAYEQLELMFNAAWYTYLKEGAKGTINMPYWAKRVANPLVLNIALKLLSKEGYLVITTQPHRNWSEAKLNERKLLEYVTEQELSTIRKYNKHQKYLLDYTDEVNTDKEAAKVQIAGRISKTGLYMKGFAEAAQTAFKFDTVYMKKYYKYVLQLVNYGIEKTINKYPAILKDKANYAEVGKEILEHYIYSDSIYNAGSRASDSRGRDISGMLNKIGNPIGFKIMRSMLIIPTYNRQKATRKGLLAKYLFIAELNGYKKGTILGKIKYGINCYKNRYTHDLNLNVDKELKELPEVIWVKRTYEDIDGYYSNENYKWKVPVELDMSASVLGFYGILLNHKPYMIRCNMINENGILNDAWGHKNITNRVQFKSIMRSLYGSQRSPQDVWNDMNIPYTTEEVIAFTKELAEGEKSVANKFKDFLINNAQMKPAMKLNIRGTKFTIKCNKWFNRGETRVKYDLYNSADNTIKRIVHTDTVKVPDLVSFKRYAATALIHHLDATVMNTVCTNVYESYEWIIPIHDAAIVDAEAADMVRTVYANELEKIHNDRLKIIEDYCRSLNIPANAIEEWKTITKLVEPVKGTFKCSKMVLK